ncbi:MAG: glycosyltransferase [Rudaea sp.]|nr:glycosyltransferase [Rudaea sp.]
MRILHIGKFFPPHPGGIERTSADLCAALAARGVSVAMLAHAQPGTRCSHRVRTDEVEVTLAACHGQWLYAPVSPTFPWQLKQTIQRFRPDLLHLHLPNTSAFWALMLPSARRVPWVVHWHADIPLDSRHAGLRLAYRLYRPWEQAMLRRARAVIATSAPYRDSSPALAPWRDKTRVIPLGLPPVPSDNADAVDSTSIKWPSDGVRLLAVGRLSYFKGFDVLLRAVAQVPAISLVLIGDGECGNDLRRLARELGIDARVKFAGRIDMDPAGTATLAAAYAAAEIFCLPSTERAESFGLVLLEAMRAGLPTVASDISGSGVGYVVRDGESGLLVPPGDVAALAAALRRLADDAGLRRRLGVSGARCWREEFTLDRAAERTLALYRELLEPTARPGKASPAASLSPGSDA